VAGNDDDDDDDNNNFSFLQIIKTGSGTHPAFILVGTGGSFPREKLPGREADHPLPSRAEV
jgi:hypothetical protein